MAKHNAPSSLSHTCALCPNTADSIALLKKALQRALQTAHLTALGHPECSPLFALHLLFSLSHNLATQLNHHQPQAMAEAIGLIASIITIVQVSGKVAVLCNKYRRRVRRAQTESEELKKEVEAVKDLFDGVKRIHDGPHGHKLAASEKIRGAIPDIETLLQDLQKKLKIIKSRKVLGRLTTGHLKWPFNAKEAKAIIQKLQSHRQAVLDALNVDQTYVFRFKFNRFVG